MSKPTLSQFVVNNFVRGQLPDVERFHTVARWDDEDDCWLWEGTATMLDGRRLEYAFSDHAPMESWGADPLRPPTFLAVNR